MACASFDNYRVLFQSGVRRRLALFSFDAMKIVVYVCVRAAANKKGAHRGCKDNTLKSFTNLMLR
jgi:hypothetical protein